MASAPRVLLVEGKADEAFYGEICKKVNISAKITVAPPRALGGTANNKEGVFNLLPSLLSQFADGSLSRLAIIVDADFAVEHGLGFTRTYERVRQIVSPFGFNPVRRGQCGGLLFESSDGYHDLGLWIMPDNRVDGMLEDWVKASVIATDAALLADAVRATSAVRDPKFKDIHKIKAEVANWLSWQIAPGRGMEYAVQAGLIDEHSGQYQELVRWLRYVYG